MKICILLAVFFAITACSNVDYGNITDPDRLSQSAWTLRGKISIKYQSQGFVARFVWKRENSGNKILFRMPFGRYVKVSVKEGLCVLENSEGDLIQAVSLESLMMKEMGWSFPIRRAIFWVQGLPYPADTIENLGDDVRSTFKQGEWVVRIEEYFVDRQVPRKIYFSSGGIEIKIVANEWNFNNGSIK
ncbi:MAG: outer membrane lipoprotein LolB [Pseudomonadota bacterium]|nr:outer membrane lipoprotein LolB [Pseudomonadota bacterium]